MATIHHASYPLKTNDDFDDVEALATNYWGNLEEEKIFPLPFWKAQQMLSVSPSKQIAFHVNDMDNKALVNAGWEVFNSDYEDLLAAQTNPEEYYFVLHENTFESIRHYVPFGNPINQLMLLGRLGRTEAGSGDFLGLILTTKYVIIKPGSSGNGASTGVRLPPGGDEDDDE